ncbi:tetratricopeptide repeat protein [Streptomyces sp. N2-109]|uniref:Tetratricopeptide repeat protein n=1 Tax=Streptomyces gossypii TaxID=2883101 RepID=A0ABT2JQB9_9ACTN|nr:tetratricopeptide repeat protein [Streptomyces gossypii]MCT2590077.1 tetratricopeptide repeat protein [Streptomyces gossypii]
MQTPMSEPMSAELAEAVALREQGSLDEARIRLLTLSARHPEDPQTAYQTAWVHDALGLELEALPYYERAVATGGLSPEDRHGVLLGLASTHRVLGAHGSALAVLETALQEFPGNPALRAFRALALTNAGRAEEALSDLLHVLVDTTADPQLREYARALSYYADHLDETAG